jgi:hypothetical protein
MTIGSKRFLSFLCSLLLVGVGLARTSVAQTPTPNEVHIENVRVKLVREVQHLRESNYQQAGAEIVEPLARDRSKRFAVQLQAGWTYAIVAACGKDCSHVQLSLYDAAGALLVSSPAKEDVVIVSGAPIATGAYAAEVAAPGCSEKICHVGIGVMRLDASPPGMTAPPPSSAPPRHDLIEALQRALKRVGCDPGEIDGLWGDDTREALGAFSKHANIQISSDEPTDAALRAVSSAAGRVCPQDVQKHDERRASLASKSDRTPDSIQKCLNRCDAAGGSSSSRNRFCNKRCGN